MPNQETKNRWVTINYFNKIKDILAPVMVLEPRETSDFVVDTEPLEDSRLVHTRQKPAGYKSINSSAARII
jgi:hypothetical protein